MSRALIGSTGFVGGNLGSQAGFSVHYHSRNIEEIRGRTFDVVVSAATPAEKSQANADPATDASSIYRLTECLERVRARKFVLISTVDVYPDPFGVDEASEIDARRSTPFGRHRKELEEFVQSRFDPVVVRLPGLFGNGLKTNVIYDLMHNHPLEDIDPRAEYQFYSLDWIWRDVRRALESGLSLVNIATEPICVAELARDVFGVELASSADDARAVRYDVRSRHAERFGGRDGYLYDRATMLAALRAYVGRSAMMTA